MPEDKYKLTRHGKKYVRKRARAEAGRSGSGKLGAKIRKTFTKAKYAIPRGGTGTELGSKKTMVKPKKVAYGYRKIEGEGVKGREKSKQVEKFDVEGSSEKTYKRRIAGGYERKGKSEPSTKASPSKFYKGTPEAAKNKKSDEAGTGFYKRGSRTKETIEKKRDLDRELRGSKKKYGKRKGARKFQRKRKKEMKEEFKREEFLRK